MTQHHMIHLPHHLVKVELKKMIGKNEYSINDTQKFPSMLSYDVESSYHIMLSYHLKMYHMMLSHYLQIFSYKKQSTISSSKFMFIKS